MTTMDELKVLQSVDFDWAMHLESVWRDNTYDVRQLNRHLRIEIGDELSRLKDDPSILSPLGRVIVGKAGTGKTHLLASIREKISFHNIGFVLADLTDVHDFWETILQGYLNSLDREYLGKKSQGRLYLERLVNYTFKEKNTDVVIDKLIAMEPTELKGFLSDFLSRLSKVHKAETRKFQDVIRAFVLLNSDLYELSGAGYSWLHALGIDEKDKQQFCFQTTRQKPSEIIKGLSWIMSLTGPSILAIDQMDSIVKQNYLASGIASLENAGEEQRVSHSIIQGIAGGIMGLRDITSRTLVLISCLDTTWGILEKKALKSSVDRFREPEHLERIQHSKTASDIIALRLRKAFEKHNFTAPYRTWPFKPEAFDSVTNWIPRKLLQTCASHRDQCLKRGKVVELETFESTEITKTIDRPGNYQSFNEDLDIQRKKMDTAALLDEKNEDMLGRLLFDACRFLKMENPPPDDIDVFVDASMAKGAKYPPIHTRIRVVYHDEGDRENHYCIRAIQKKHANSFKPRLKAAMTESGIDRKISFRKLDIVRGEKLSKATQTQKLIDQFLWNGGQFLRPSEHDLAIIMVIQQLEKRKDPEFEAWLISRKPVSSLALMNNALLLLNYDKTGESAKQKRQNDRRKPAEIKTMPAAKPKPPKSTAAVSPAGQSIPIGFGVSGEQRLDSFQIPATSLTNHTAVLAGSGSGKTVLVRRLIEESALIGIPSIVIDGAGDLSRLGDAWPAFPEGWTEKDIEKAERYHEAVDVNIWTPGAEKGNPVFSDPIPDISAIQDNPDELEQALTMTRESLQAIVATGNSSKARNKVGVLSAALHYYFKMRQTSGLPGFIELLSDLPLDASGGISQADKLSREMADNLRAQLQIDPLLKQGSPLLDPFKLLGKHRSSEKTMISVISLVGLPGMASRQQFLNNLAMIMFSWIKKNPSEIQGLLVIDEAKDFVPSTQSTPCKSSLLQLIAQARKYGLGLVFATQAPKSIDHNIIANCSTQFYGKANSPAAINAIKEQLKNQGGTGLDIPKLVPGRFYAHSTGMNAPIKIEVPMCMSHHPPAPPSEMEIIEKAADLPASK